MKESDIDPGARWKAFGQYLKRERERAGKTQKEIADLAGLHPVHVSRIETGDSGIRTQTLDLLIESLGLNPGEAYSQAGFWPTGAIWPSPMESEADFGTATGEAIVMLFRKLTVPQQRHMLRILTACFGGTSDIPQE